MLKKIIKNITPPLLYIALRNFINRKNYRPTWSRFNFEPLNGINIFFDPNGSWQRKMLSGQYDPYLFESLKSIDTQGKIIFDIGSHIGFHSLLFARLTGEKGKVYAFEPNKVNVERIKLILNKNQDVSKIVRVHTIAISNKVGYEDFVLNNDIESGRSSGNFIKGADTFWEKETYYKKGFFSDKVETISLDQLDSVLGIKDLPDIMKIDVEGAEYMVLLGAERLISNKKPIIFIEVHSILNMFNVLIYLQSKNYSVKIINAESSGPCFIEAKPINKDENSHNHNI